VRASRPNRALLSLTIVVSVIGPFRVARAAQVGAAFDSEEYHQ
jgi:hypothetical protein